MNARLLVLLGGFAALVLLTAPARGSLIAYYGFDAATAADGSGSGNHGTVGASIAFIADNPLGAGQAASAGGGGGAARTIVVPTSSSLESMDDQLTIAFWMKGSTAGQPSWARLFQHGTEAGGDRTWMVNRHTSTGWTNVRVDTVGAGGQFNQNIAQFGADTLDGAWHHLAYVLDNGAWRKYVDGVMSSGSYLHGDGFQNTRPLVMFGILGSGQYVGALDDVGLWSNPLSTAEVRSLYTVPRSLGFDYNLDDLTDLWLAHAAGPGGQASVKGVNWSFTASLPLGMNPGDAYRSGSDVYLALGSGTGLHAVVPEPSTWILAGLGMLGTLACPGRRRKP